LTAGQRRLRRHRHSPAWRLQRRGIIQLGPGPHHQPARFGNGGDLRIAVTPRSRSGSRKAFRGNVGRAGSARRRGGGPAAPYHVSLRNGAAGRLGAVVQIGLGIVAPGVAHRDGSGTSGECTTTVEPRITARAAWKCRSARPLRMTAAAWPPGQGVVGITKMQSQALASRTDPEHRPGIVTGSPYTVGLGDERQPPAHLHACCADGHGVWIAERRCHRLPCLRQAAGGGLGFARR